MLPRSVEAVIAELAKLPGIGRRSAERLAFDLLNRSPGRPRALADALDAMARDIAPCPVCFYYADAGHCALCNDPRRDSATICVVETAMDVAAFDRVGSPKPRYHVLGGRLSPTKGVTAADLHIAQLLDRLPGVAEIILATSPSVEGDATARFLAGEIAPSGVRVTRIGRGVPMGGSLEHSDAETLRQSLETRRPFAQ